jgi:hypothetical protein
LLGAIPGANVCPSSTTAFMHRQKQDLVFDTGRRRSMRVFFSAPIQVSGQDSKNRNFAENTRTLIVNAHGALISLAAAVTPGQQIMVSNEVTKQLREFRVVCLRAGDSGKSSIGIEFVKPSPTFWQIDYPPDDWVLPEG